MKHIAIIEDNIELAKGLESNLLIEGYQVTLCHDGALAVQHLIDYQPDLLVLDMMLPHKDGFEIINQLNKYGIHLPTLCLTARSTEMDKVRALRSGADDYLTKPFGLMELLARVEALLRRNHPQKNQQASNLMVLGHLTIDLNAQQINVHSKAVSLSPKEYHLLVYLFNNKGHALSRIEIMEQVWGHQAAINSRTVDTHIAELRKKCQLGSKSTVQINTISKIGYKLSLNTVNKA